MKMIGSKLIINKEDVEKIISHWLRQTKYSDCSDGSITVQKVQNFKVKHSRGGAVVSFLKDEMLKVAQEEVEKPIQKAAEQCPTA